MFGPCNIFLSLVAVKLRFNSLQIPYYYFSFFVVIIVNKTKYLKTKIKKLQE